MTKLYPFTKPLVSGRPKIRIGETKFLDKLCNIPFYWPEHEQKEYCCLQHVIGLPKKNGMPMPLFDYEKKILDELVKFEQDSKKNRHVWIKKSTGLGITELVLRYMIWLCYRDNAHRGAQMCLVTGPNIDLAKGLIRRIKNLCRPITDKITGGQTAAILNGCRVEAFPSHHLDAMRSLTSPRFIFIDEADFFPPKELKNARDVAERYIAKSDPYIAMVSTPNLPGGLFDSIEKEPEDKCIYRRIFLPYRVGLGRIYTQQEIDRAKASPSFEREYNLKYGFGVGDIFPGEFVDACTSRYDLAMEGGRTVLAVDPGYGSSKFAIVGVEELDEILYVKEAMEYSRPSPGEMIDLVHILSKRFRTVIVDSAHPGVVKDLERMRVDARKVNFRELEAMTALAAQVVKERQIMIHPGFVELLYQLKSITMNERGHPDKKKLNTFDLGDALLMAIYHLKNDSGLYIAKI